jgi:serine/threonine protein kinase
MSVESDGELAKLAQGIQTRLLCVGPNCNTTHRCQDQVSWLRRQFLDLQRAKTWPAFLTDAEAAALRMQLEQLTKDRTELVVINSQAFPPLTPAEEARKMDIENAIRAAESKLEVRQQDWIRTSAERKGFKVKDFQQRVGLGNAAFVFPCTNARGEVYALKATREFSGWFFENEVALLRLASEQSKELTPRYVTHWSTPLSQCIVMELFGSGTLHALLPRLTDQTATILQEVQRMIAQLAALGINHGDLHLKNILVDLTEGRPMSMRMVDFGFSTRGIVPATARDAMTRRFQSEWKVRLEQQRSSATGIQSC